MDRLLAILAFVLGILIVAFTFPDGNAALVVVIVCSSVTVAIIWHFGEDAKILLTRLFVTALFARLIFGTFVHVLEVREKFSGDSNTYHLAGKKLMRSWFGLHEASGDRFLEHFSTDIGWGITYLVAGIYSVTGSDILAAQFFCAVIGAATVPLVYVCVRKIFRNDRVSLVSALLVGFYPAFVIWSSQLLKDGLIVFCLVLAMAMILNLRERFDYTSAVVLLIALFGVLSLRFYIFYMMSAAMLGAFLVGSGKSNQSIVRNLIILMVLGLGLAYLGVGRDAGTNLEKYGGLEQLQRARSGAAQAGSGFGQELDVSTTEGAISALPVGFVYVMFAPFPWQIFSNTTFLIALPDMIIWWLSIPLLVMGIIYTIRHRLRDALGIIIFSLMLTLAYSLFQGNIGTAYRHRIQIQVFLFMFVAVGWTLVKERRENKKALRNAEILRSNKRLRRNAEAPIG